MVKQLPHLHTFLISSVQQKETSKIFFESNLDWIK